MYKRYNISVCGHQINSKQSKKQAKIIKNAKQNKIIEKEKLITEKAIKNIIQPPREGNKIHHPGTKDFDKLGSCALVIH